MLSKYKELTIIIIGIFLFLIVCGLLTTNDLRVSQTIVQSSKHGKCVINQYESISEFECDITPDYAVINANK